MTSIELINEELKRLHELLCVSNDYTQIEVLKLIENIHRNNLYSVYYIPLGSNIENE